MTTKEIADAANLSENARSLLQDDSAPAAYLDSLEKAELYQDAVRFLATRLAPDSAIKWAVACMRDLQAPEEKNQKDEPLEASERWIKLPNDATRRDARSAADRARDHGPSSLIAMAVFFSGGSVASPGAPEVQPPPGTAQRMAAGSIQVTVVMYQPERLTERYRKALALGKMLDPELKIG